MSQTQTQIRIAQRDDIRPALTMKQTAWRETYSGLRDEAFFAHHEAGLEAEIDWWTRGFDAGAEFHIAETDGEIVGLAGATPALPEDADTGAGIEMGMLYVLADYEHVELMPGASTSTSTSAHPGLRSVLMETVLAGRDALVWTIQEDTATVEFYQSHGFVPDGTTEALGGDWAGLTDMRMVRR